MLLKNKQDGKNYRVRSEEYEGGIRIFAVAEQTGAKDMDALSHAQRVK